MTKKYIVKRRTLSPAKRNPFKPRQTIKRSRWITFGTFDSIEAALERAKALQGGMREVAVFHGGKVAAAENQYHRGLEVSAAPGARP